jgi:NAD(P)-dependent dehydrogenase (short-subunit alcohol dehydrogenase family)
MSTLSGRVALVTGGATGLGAAIVERLASLDVHVACAYNTSQADAEALAERLNGFGKTVFPVKLDVTKNEEVAAVVKTISQHFCQPIHILVNNAGDAFGLARVEIMEVEVWEKVIAINLTGPFLCAKHCIPGMKEAGFGRIINMSSVSARTGAGPGYASYAASKGGVESLTRTLAKELGPFKITVNAVAPGLIHTRLLHRLNKPEVLERQRIMMPLERIGEPEDVAKVVSFLASDDAAYITGDVIPVNGGMRFD